MIYVCIMDYVNIDVIARVRPRHRTYMMGLIAEGKVISAGSFLPDGEGGLFLYSAESMKDAEQMVAQDPYIREGAVSKHVLREYEIHGANPLLLRVARA